MPGSNAATREQKAPTSKMPGLSKRIGLIGLAFLLGWYYPLRAVLTYFRPVPVNQKLTFVWSEKLLARIRVRLVELEGAPLLTDRRCLYFCPHRSFADLFLHKYITRGLGATLSRAGMGVVFPMTWLTTRTDRSTWFFRRDKHRGVKAFYNWLDEQFDLCPLPGLIVYPEGHRHLDDKPLPLMGGMINYAYSRKLPVQIISTHRTERVVDEKHWDYQPGQTVHYRIEPPIDPGAFDSRVEFRDHISDLFERAYAEVTVNPDLS